MYRNEKRTLKEICDTLKEIHEALPGITDAAERAELCGAAQQGAIKIGERLEEEDAEKYADTVRQLEEYCELIYRLSEKSEVTEEDLKVPEETVYRVGETISAIKCRIKIVFFPYKAEMWDSLESFFLAARDDPDCDAFLVPIPYFEFDKESNQMVSRYDGARFPASEDPIPYNKFDHTDGSIDIAYVHNPYDDRNLVTSIHPAYYSKELKKYVGKLIYTPYFVTNGLVSDEQKDLPVYQNMDYEIIQSEYSKKCCEGLYYYDKILPFGSSKLDLIINKCKQGVDMPEEWKETIGNRRTLMLNSSLNDLLYWNETALDKLEYFFELIKGNEKVAIIWRPHPLYESTLRSMRPELLPRYERIKQRFLDERIGVFDDNPDISDTVALADGYIGSGSSSVINLFAAAGKPVCIFNNMIREAVSKADRRVMLLTGMEYVRGRIYLHPQDINAIFSVPVDDLSSPLRYEGSVPDTVNWTYSLYGLARAGDKLYMAPMFAEDAVCYDPVLKNIETLGSVGRQYDVRYAGMPTPLPSRKSVYFFPSNIKYLIMEYVIGRQEWIYHSSGLVKLYEGLERPSHIGLLYGGATYDDRLYYSTALCNRVIKLTPGREDEDIILLGSPEFTTEIKIILKGASREGLWLIYAGSPDLYLAPWESLQDRSKWRCYPMPEDYEYTHDDFGDVDGGQGGLIDHGKSMIIVPHRHPHMIKLDKESGGMTYMAEDFFKDSEKKGIEYQLKNQSICGPGFLMGKNKYCVQRMRDLHIAIINLDDGSFEEFVPEMPEDVFDRLVPEGAGFFKGDVYDYFRMQEKRLFPMENFLEVFARDGYRGIRVKQLEALSTLAANLDGTCGIKTHEFLKQKILEEDVSI